jgi:hypothetical protein
MRRCRTGSSWPPAPDDSGHYDAGGAANAQSGTWRASETDVRSIGAVKTLAPAMHKPQGKLGSV